MYRFLGLLCMFQILFAQFLKDDVFTGVKLNPIRGVNLGGWLVPEDLTVKESSIRRRGVPENISDKR